MRILVTGSQGFIGSWVMRELDAAGHEGLTVKNATLSLGSDKPDMVIHLRALVGIEKCEAAPAVAIGRNISETFFIAQACAQHGIPMIYGSSIGVRMPTSLYEITKGTGETMCLHELGPHKIPGGGVRCARLSFCYGPGAKPGHNLVSSYLAALMGGDGEPVIWREYTRPWIYAQDVARGLVAIAEHFDSLPLVVDVGQAQRVVTNRQLADLCWQAVAPGVPHHFPEVDPDPRRPSAVYPDDTALRSVGWAPKMRLESGLRATARWLRDEGHV